MNHNALIDVVSPLVSENVQLSDSAAVQLVAQ